MTEKYWFRNGFVWAKVPLNWLTSGLKTLHNLVMTKLKREVFGYNWINRLNFHKFNVWILSNNLFGVKGRAKFSVPLQIRHRLVFQVPFNLEVCTVNFITETEVIQWEKTALHPLVFSWSVSFEFNFCWGKTRFTHAIAANKLATSK